MFLNYFARLKAINLFVALTFIFSGTGYSQGLTQLNTVSSVSLNNSNFTLPRELGVIQHQTPKIHETNVFHIQTAHGNYQAQKNIESILNYLNQNKKIDLLLLEGSVSELEPELLQFVRDKKINAQIADDLTRKAYLKGAELFLMNNPKVKAYGIEDEASYMSNSKDFVAVLSQREKTSLFLSNIKAKVEGLKSSLLNADIRLSLKNKKDFDQKKITFIQRLENLKKQANQILNIDFDQPGQQLDWPMLFRVFKLQKFQDQFNLEQFHKEKNAFLKLARKTVSAKEHKQLKAFFNSVDSDAEGALALLMESVVRKLPANFNFDVYPNVSFFVGNFLLKNELVGDRLFNESEKLNAQILDKLTESKEQKRVLELILNFELLSRLFELQLTPKDYKALKSKGNTLDPSRIIHEINTLSRVKKTQIENLEEVKALFGKSVQFYEGAIQRDSGMFDKATSLIESRRAKNVAIITGGFHSESFKNYYEDKSNYSLIAPQIDSVEGQETYVHSFLKTSSHGLKDSTIETPFFGGTSVEALVALGVDYFGGVAPEFIISARRALVGSGVIEAGDILGLQTTLNESPWGKQFSSWNNRVGIQLSVEGQDLLAEFPVFNEVVNVSANSLGALPEAKRIEPTVAHFKKFLAQDRFSRIAKFMREDKKWTAEEFHRLAGSVLDVPETANALADSLYYLVMKHAEQGTFAATGGVMDSVTAKAAVEAGAEALYLSGWQTSHHMGEPDLAQYQLDSVPNEVKEIYTGLVNLDKNLQYQFRTLSRDLTKKFFPNLFQILRRAPNKASLEQMKPALIRSFVDSVRARQYIFTIEVREDFENFATELGDGFISELISNRENYVGFSSDNLKANREKAVAGVLENLNDVLLNALIPIYADGDTAHKSPTQLASLFIAAKSASIHIEDQAHGQKKCGHMAGKVLTSLGEFMKRLWDIRYEAIRRSSTLVIIARSDAEGAKLLEDDNSAEDHYFIKGATVEGIPSLKDVIRLSHKKEYNRGVDPEVRLSEIEANFPKIAASIREVWNIRGEEKERLLEHNESLTPKYGGNPVYVDELWSNRLAIELEDPNFRVRLNNVVVDASGKEWTIQEVLDAEVSGWEEEVAASSRLTNVWAQEADVMTYPQAVERALVEAGRSGEVEAWNEATNPLEITLDFQDLRELAINSFNIEIYWDHTLAQTSEGFFQIDNSLGVTNAGIRLRMAARAADILWMEQKEPDLKNAKAFADIVDNDPELGFKPLKAVNLSPSFNWNNPDNWHAALSLEQRANIKKAMQSKDFDWGQPDTWGDNPEDVQAMVDALRTFSTDMGKQGFAFQFVTIFQDHVAHLNVYRVMRELVKVGAYAFVSMVQQVGQKIGSPFTNRHQNSAGAEVRGAQLASINRIANGTASSREKGNDVDTSNQFNLSAKSDVDVNTTTEGLVVREDLAEDFSGLFGDKEVNGRTVNVEGTIESLTREFGLEIGKQLHARKARRDSGEGYGFADPSKELTDADGNTLTVEQIREGLINKDSQYRWVMNSTVPVPAEVLKAGLQGTGPADDMGMLMGAINAGLKGAVSWMFDWEDAGNDYQQKLYQAWTYIKEVISGTWIGRAFKHPTKKNKEGEPKEYSIKVDRDQWPTIFHRVPGLHLKNRQITLDGRNIPATIAAFTIHLLNNYDAQKENESNVYFYVPKIESPEEALIISKILKRFEETLGLERGSIKIEMLNERGTYAAQQEVILWILRENLIGPNVGRWDYINGRFEMVKDDPSKVFPDPNSVGMTEASMTEYTRRNALITVLVTGNRETGALENGMPIGGMSAVMETPIKATDTEEIAAAKKATNDGAVQAMFLDKLRERLTGLLVIDGVEFDAYRQSWVATVSTKYVEAGAKPLQATREDLQALVDGLSVEERQKFINLGLVSDAGGITPYIVTQKDLDELFSEEAYAKIFTTPTGKVTLDGIRYAIFMASEYGFQQLNGNNAAAVDDYKTEKERLTNDAGKHVFTGKRLMNDFATYEIFWHWVKLLEIHGIELDEGGQILHDGREVKNGEKVTKELILEMLQERDLTVTEYFNDNPGGAFDKSKSPVIMEILKRKLTHDEWITYGSRVLLAVIESNASERDALLDAIFDSRENVTKKLSNAKAKVSEKATIQNISRLTLAQKALEAHDFVYDTFPLSVYDWTQTTTEASSLGAAIEDKISTLSNVALQSWIREMVEFTGAADIQIVDESDDAALLEQAVAAGELTKLADGNYYTRSHKKDTARSVKKTFVATENPEDAGHYNNWSPTAEKKEVMEGLLKGSMAGKTMYVLPYLMGTAGSDLSQVGVQVTSSRYVALNMFRLAKVGNVALAELGDEEKFVRGVHEPGDIDKIYSLIAEANEKATQEANELGLEGDARKEFIEEAEDGVDLRNYGIFPDEMLIMSYGSNYGGNALLNKKFHALRYATWSAIKEGWLAEHMAVVEIKNLETGKLDYVAYAAPSASGKTNFAMIEVPDALKGKYEVRVVSDDIIFARAREGEGLYATNAENGYFGVAKGTNAEQTPKAMVAIGPNTGTIFTNVAINTITNEVWWTDKTKFPPGFKSKAHYKAWAFGEETYIEGSETLKVGTPDLEGWEDWTGEKIADWSSGERLQKNKVSKKLEPREWAHPNARYAASAERVQDEIMSEHWRDPKGVRISAIFWGGRIPEGELLVRQLPTIESGIYDGAVMGVMGTAAAAGEEGVMKRDPFANRPFFSQTEAADMENKLRVIGSLGEQAPAFFHVNWFRQNEDGSYIWPGFMENFRVILWALERASGADNYTETSVGLVPKKGSVHFDGVDIDPSDLLSITTTVDSGYWEQEVSGRRDFLGKLKNVPSFIIDEQSKLESAIANSLGDGAFKEMQILGRQWVENLIPEEGLTLNDGTKVTRITDPSSLPSHVSDVWEGHVGLVIARNESVGYTAIIGLHHLLPYKKYGTEQWLMSGAIGGVRRLKWDSREAQMISALTLSRAMTSKNAMIGLDLLPLGGSKTMIQVDGLDPNKKIENLSQVERGKLRDAYLSLGRVLENIPVTFVGQDMNTPLPLLLTIGETSPSHVVGHKDLALGGDNASPWTARGVFNGIKASIQKVFGEDVTLEGKIIAVQGGQGGVGTPLVKALIEEGAIVVMSELDSQHAIVKETYSNVPTIPDVSTFNFGSLENGSVALLAKSDQIYDVPASVFSPTAIKYILDQDTIARLSEAGIKIVAGAANEQFVANKARQLSAQLFDTGILWAVDYVINGGGVSGVFTTILGLDMPSIVESIGERVGFLVGESIRQNSSPLEVVTPIATEAIIENASKVLDKTRVIVEAQTAAKSLGAQVASFVTPEFKTIFTGPRDLTLPLVLEEYGRELQEQVLTSFDIALPAELAQIADNTILSADVIRLTPTATQELGRIFNVLPDANTSTSRALFVHREVTDKTVATDLQELVLLAGMDKALKLTLWFSGNAERIAALKTEVRDLAIAEYGLYPDNLVIVSAPENLDRSLNETIKLQKVPTGLVGVEEVVGDVTAQRGLLLAKVSSGDTTQHNLTATLLAKKLLDFSRKQFDTKIYTGIELAGGAALWDTLLADINAWKAIQAAA